MQKTIPICPHRGLCTVDCPDRDGCTISRTPLLIHAIVIHYRQQKIYPDEYINEVAQVKQDLINTAVHRDELLSSRHMVGNIEITAL